MATIISTKTSGVGGLEVTGDASGVLQLASNNGTTAVTVDASQNVGIGVSPSAWNSAIKAVQVNTATLWSNTSNTNIFSSNVLRGTAYAASYIGTGTAGEFGFNLNGLGEWSFSTAPSGSSGASCTLTERMRIDASGNVLVGTASSTIWSNSSNTSADRGFNYSGTYLAATNFNDATCIFNRTGSNGLNVQFRRSGTAVGGIDVTTTSTAYNTSSDYRLKENIVPMVGALSTVAQLNPVFYTWKEDGSNGQGFIAHELAQVVPDCVSGEKDAVDADGNPVYQGIDTSFLVATLTAAIQELKAIIDTQAERIAVLENK